MSETASRCVGKHARKGLSISRGVRYIDLANGHTLVEQQVEQVDDLGTVRGVGLGAGLGLGLGLGLEVEVRGVVGVGVRGRAGG